MPESDLHHALRWLSTWLLAALLTLWPLSGWFTAMTPPSALGQIGIHAGAVWVIPDSGLAHYGRHPLSGPTFLYADGLGDDGQFEMSFRHGRYFLEYIAIPMWMFVCVAAVPVWWFWRQQVRYALRRRRGQCLACGYDLCATSSDGPCAECGCLPSSLAQAASSGASRE